jgi:hypothetical protein
MVAETASVLARDLEYLGLLELGHGAVWTAMDGIVGHAWLSFAVVVVASIDAPVAIHSQARAAMGKLHNRPNVWSSARATGPGSRGKSA